MAYDLASMPDIMAYDPNDPGIKAIFSPHSVDPPKEHIKPSWLTPDKIKSPLKGDKDPYYLNEADRSIFHIVPPQEYHLPESQLREMDVICIGSGMAGITAGIMTQWRLKKVNLKVFEKNPTAAGTWYENRYPGCKIDVPSHFYSFRFAPNDWASGYPAAPETFDYFMRVYWEYGVDQFVRFNTAVTKLVYDDPSAKWEVHLRDVKSGKTWIELADVVINGQGFLNRPKFPKEISGIETFKGKLMHSARWDNTYDTVGKNVALIGTGSSGLQIAGAIGPYTKHFTIFQRTPSWLLPHFAPLVFKEGEREEFKKRDFFWEYYKRSWETAERFWTVFTEGSRMQERVIQMAKDKLAREVKDPELRKKLTPNYPWGCRRLTPSLNYYQVIQMPHVELVTGDVIDKVVPEGVMTKGGKLYECDTLVFATGFNTTYYNEDMPVYGRNGLSLGEVWKPYAWAHNSMTTTGFPGLFFVMGPLAPIAANSIIIEEEQQLNYIISAIKLMQQSPNPIRSFDPHREKIKKFYDESQTFLKEKTVWRHLCGGWYHDPVTDFILQWPGPANHYMDHIASFLTDRENYDIFYWASDEERLEAGAKKKAEIERRNAVGSKL